MGRTSTRARAEYRLALSCYGNSSNGKRKDACQYWKPFALETFLHERFPCGACKLKGLKSAKWIAAAVLGGQQQLVCLWLFGSLIILFRKIPLRLGPVAQWRIWLDYPANFYAILDLLTINRNYYKNMMMQWCPVRPGEDFNVAHVIFI